LRDNIGNKGIFYRHPNSIAPLIIQPGKIHPGNNITGNRHQTLEKKFPEKNKNEEKNNKNRPAFRKKFFKLHFLVWAEINAE